MYRAVFALPLLLSAAACDEAAQAAASTPVAPLSAAASYGSAGSASAKPNTIDSKKPESVQAGGAAPAPQPAPVPGDAEASEGVDLDCPHGGKASVVKVAFRCTSVTSYTCKDLSNIVLEFADGSRQRWEGQSGHENSFSGTGDNAGKVVTRVWVKAGPNFSGDGPGYGERVEAPADSCKLPGAGSGGAAGSGGTAGGGGAAGSAACENLPDGSCGPGSFGGSGGGGAGGSEACVDLPDRPCGTPVYDVAGAPAPDPDETPSPD